MRIAEGSGRPRFVVAPTEGSGTTLLGRGSQDRQIDAVAAVDTIVDTPSSGCTDVGPGCRRREGRDGGRRACQRPGRTVAIVIASPPGLVTDADRRMVLCSLGPDHRPHLLTPDQSPDRLERPARLPGAGTAPQLPQDPPGPLWPDTHADVGRGGPSSLARPRRLGDVALRPIMADNDGCSLLVYSSDSHAGLARIPPRRLARALRRLHRRRPGRRPRRPVAGSCPGPDVDVSAPRGERAACDGTGRCRPGSGHELRGGAHGGRRGALARPPRPCQSRRGGPGPRRDAPGDVPPPAGCHRSASSRLGLLRDGRRDRGRPRPPGGPTSTSAATGRSWTLLPTRKRPRSRSSLSSPRCSGTRSRAKNRWTGPGTALNSRPCYCGAASTRRPRTPVRYPSSPRRLLVCPPTLPVLSRTRGCGPGWG